MGPGPVIGAARLNWVFHDLLMLQVCTQYVSLCHFPCIQPHWIPPKWVATGLSFLQGFYEGINMRARSHHVEKTYSSRNSFCLNSSSFLKVPSSIVSFSNLSMVDSIFSFIPGACWQYLSRHRALHTSCYTSWLFKNVLKDDYIWQTTDQPGGH